MKTQRLPLLLLSSFLALSTAVAGPVWAQPAAIEATPAPASEATPAPASESTPAESATCQDLLNMVATGVPESLIVQTIQGGHVPLPADELECLRKGDASAEVLAAAGGKTAEPEPTPAEVSLEDMSDDELDGFIDAMEYFSPTPAPPKEEEGD